MVTLFDSLGPGWAGGAAVLVRVSAVDTGRHAVRGGKLRRCECGAVVLGPGVCVGCGRVCVTIKKGVCDE